MSHELVAKTAGRTDRTRAAGSDSSPPGSSTKDSLRVQSGAERAVILATYLVVLCRSLFALSGAHAEEFSWQLSGGYSEDQLGDVLRSETGDFSAAYYPRAVDDSNGPYALATFLNRSSVVAINVSSDEQVQSRIVRLRGGEVADVSDVDIRSRTSANSFSGRHVWPRTGWYLGGDIERAEIERDDSSTDIEEFGVVAGKYLGSRTTVALSLGSTTSMTPAGEATCLPSGSCEVRFGNESRNESVDVSVRHVGDIGRLVYSVSATGLTGALDKPGDPAAPAGVGAPRIG